MNSSNLKTIYFILLIFIVLLINDFILLSVFNLKSNISKQSKTNYNPSVNSLSVNNNSDLNIINSSEKNLDLTLNKKEETKIQDFDKEFNLFKDSFFSCKPYFFNNTKKSAYFNLSFEKNKCIITIQDYDKNRIKKCTFDKENLTEDLFNDMVATQSFVNNDLYSGACEFLKATN